MCFFKMKSAYDKGFLMQTSVSFQGPFWSYPFFTPKHFFKNLFFNISVYFQKKSKKIDENLNKFYWK